MSDTKNRDKAADGGLRTTDLFVFAAEYLVPVIRYTADKKSYIHEQQLKHCDGQDRDDYDEWAKSRAKLAVEKWDELMKANTPEQPPAPTHNDDN